MSAGLLAQRQPRRRGRFAGQRLVEEVRRRSHPPVCTRPIRHHPRNAADTRGKHISASRRDYPRPGPGQLGSRKMSALSAGQKTGQATEPAQAIHGQAGKKTRRRHPHIVDTRQQNGRRRIGPVLWADGKCARCLQRRRPADPSRGTDSPGNPGANPQQARPGPGRACLPDGRDELRTQRRGLRHRCLGGTAQVVRPRRAHRGRAGSSREIHRPGQGSGRR